MPATSGGRRAPPAGQGLWATLCPVAVKGAAEGASEEVMGVMCLCDRPSKSSGQRGGGEGALVSFPGLPSPRHRRAHALSRRLGPRVTWRLAFVSLDPAHTPSLF